MEENNSRENLFHDKVRREHLLSINSSVFSKEKYIKVIAAGSLLEVFPFSEKTRVCWLHERLTYEEQNSLVDISTIQVKQRALWG